MKINQKDRAALVLLCRLYNRLWKIQRKSFTNDARNVVGLVDGLNAPHRYKLSRWEPNTQMEFQGRKLTESEGEIYFHIANCWEIPGAEKIEPDRDAKELSGRYVFSQGEIKDLLVMFREKEYSKQWAIYIIDNISSYPIAKDDAARVIRSMLRQAE